MTKEEIEELAKQLWHKDVTALFPDVDHHSWGEDPGAYEFYMSKALRQKLKEQEPK
jgi:hypothetical protein